MSSSAAKALELQAQIRVQAEAQAAFQSELLAWEAEAKRADERLKLTKDVAKVCVKFDYVALI